MIIYVILDVVLGFEDFFLKKLIAKSSLFSSLWAQSYHSAKLI